MASKLIISLPTAVSFQNISQNNLQRKQEEFRRLLSRVENTPPPSTMLTTSGCKDSTLNGNHNTFPPETLSRIDELKKTIIFLKEEQKRMLDSLHQEIACLQIRNRDLLCQMILHPGSGSSSNNRTLINDANIKPTLESSKASSDPGVKLIGRIEENGEKSISNQNGSISQKKEEIDELRSTIDQQRGEIEYLTGQLKMVSMRNKTQAHESRQLDNFMCDIESRYRDKEKEILLLRKEIKDYKIEIENLRKMVSGMRRSNHVPRDVQINRVLSQPPTFPTVGAPSTIWYQNGSVPISEFRQMQRTSISANGSDHTMTSNGAQFTLPPVCNYRQVVASAPLPPPPRFFSTATVATTATRCYYSVAPRPRLRNKLYLTHTHSELGLGQNVETLKQRSSSTNAYNE